MRKCKQKPMIWKRLFLMEILTNRTLFYYLFLNIWRFNPIVYDPTIADTIEGYSDLFVDPQYAGYLDINHPENIEATLASYWGSREIRHCCNRCRRNPLESGDWGTNGVDISVEEIDGLHGCCWNRSAYEPFL